MWVIAHRGASGVAPENTLAAFERAVQLGAGFIETDLQLSRDARLVAVHDETLERTTDGRGPVSKKTLEELRQLDAGSWFDHRLSEPARSFAGERIPVVEEVLAFAREHDIGLFLEMKVKGPSFAGHALTGALRDVSEILRSVVISFDEGFLSRIRQIQPLLVTGFLYSARLPNAVATAVNAGARQLLPRADRVTPQLVADAHGADLKVVAWTANTREQMQALVSSGVDGIMTDYPHELVECLRALGK
jgi:glycerophosphoryl diester phosphodiesterase